MPATLGNYLFIKPANSTVYIIYLSKPANMSTVYYLFIIIHSLITHTVLAFSFAISLLFIQLIVSRINY